MKILVTGLAGSGKTTTRLQLRSLTPHYVFYVRNMEGEASIYTPGDTVPQIAEDPNLEIAHALCTKYNNVVFTIARYVEVPVPQRLPVDITVHVHCNLVQRVERILARDPSLSIDTISEYISSEPIDTDFEQSSDYSFDTSGHRDLLTQTLIHFVDQLKLRPSVWDPNDIAYMKQLYL
jgi:dephospho-CoA kinase